MAYYKLGETFKWFISRVIDIDDPEKLGRVKIRVIHDQTGQLGSKEKKLGGVTDSELLWAYPISAIQSASLHQLKINELEKFQTPEWIDAVGLSPTGIAVGSYAFGFYLDGHEANIPLIFGTYHKMSVVPEPRTDGTGEMLQVGPPVGAAQEWNDVARLARGEQSLPKTYQDIGRVNEPRSAYDTTYPYNLTYTTKSGHAIELDDTPGKERIHVWHKSGSYEEIDRQGRRVVKSVYDAYDVGTHSHYFSYNIDQIGEIGRDQTVHIAQDRLVEIDRDANQIIGRDHTENIGRNHLESIGENHTQTVGKDQVIAIGDNQNVTVGKNCTVTIGDNCTIIVGGDASITVSGSTNISTGGTMNISSGGSMDITAGGSMSLSAPSIDIN